MLTNDEMLRNRAKVIAQLYLNGEIKFPDMLDAVIAINEEIEEIESEEEYAKSLKDSLDSTEAFLYKGKE